MEHTSAFTRYARFIFATTALFALVALLVAYLGAYRAPSDFPKGVIVKVEPDSTLNQISESLKEKHIIRSQVFFKGFVVLMGGTRKLAQGDYFFKKPVGSFVVARRIVNAEFGLSPVKITIPEGTSVTEIAQILINNLAEFNAPLFVKLGTPKEGYLFPDTYYLFPNSTPEQVVKTLEDNFNEKIKTIQGEIDAFGKPLSDVVIMASLIEKEARTEESRRVVSGILWERLKIGLPLQVDAPFVYIIGKGSGDLTLDDLKIDSPYNTYLYKGLPKGPITNPGLDSIHAAVTPTKTEYLYFLTGSDGEMYYAETHEEHVMNKEKHLR